MHLPEHDRWHRSVWETGRRLNEYQAIPASLALPDSQKRAHRTPTVETQSA